MKQITKHDVMIFLLGMLTFFIFESLYNWEQTKSDFIEGFKLGKLATEMK
ncbi:MAG: hypothetical protein KA206_10735 [Paludibacter sp.]|nr:hypothetical protein [Paludibacter sp.]